MPRKLLLIGFILTASACVSVPNVSDCTLPGSFQGGAICAETNTGLTRNLTPQEYLEFLTPQPERPDPLDPEKKLPARAGAVCQSAEDYNARKNALEKLCRELGSRCTKELKAHLQQMSVLKLNLP